MKADGAEVSWDRNKNQWLIRIKAGEEVMKRALPSQKPASSATDDTLRSLAVQTAQDDGYELDPTTVVIARRS